VEGVTSNRLFAPCYGVLIEDRASDPMSFFNRLKDPFKDIRKAVRPYGRPALHLKYNGSFEPFSKLGQMPYVPKEFEWPAWKGRSLGRLRHTLFLDTERRLGGPQLR
jgi:hypothetical protein